MIGTVAAVGFGAWALAVLLEGLILRQRPGRPSAAGLAGRLLAFGWLYGFWLSLWGEPGRAAFGALCTIGVMAGISTAKRLILGEPLAFSDLGLVPLVLRFPRLYLLEGAGLWIFRAVVLGCVALVVLTQPSVPALSAVQRIAVLAGTALLLLGLPRLAAIGPLAAALRARLPRPDADRSIRRHGLLLWMILGWLRWAGDRTRAGAALPHDGPDAPLGPDLVVVVQLESFVDPVRAFGAAEPLPGLARARARALAHGPLAVPAYGAFTMRTEHAVLTGLSDEELGFRRLDPYLARRGPAPPTLATRLAATGWHTLFMHPFPARFFGRDRVVPRLGFAESHFLDRFAECRRIGPYVSDVDFARRIVAEAAASRRPTLIAAVTMENHGPFSPHRGIGPTEDAAQHGFHLRNTDAAIDVLVEGLAALPRRVLLCLWGDHPPILKGFPAGPPPVTDYAVLLLGKDTPPAAPSPARPLSADALGRLLQRLVSPAEAGSSA